MRYRYRVIEGKARTLIIRDDGYRIHYKILDSIAINPETPEWELWADYKQCEWGDIGQQIADTLMKEAG